MHAPGSAQIELIRRYARTLRRLQVEEGARFSRPRRTTREEPLQREADRVAELLDGEADARATVA